jgi:hypothetical protein
LNPRVLFGGLTQRSTPTMRAGKRSSVCRGW